MHPAEDLSQTLAGSGQPASESLEVRLLPLVRLALRSGTGLPALVGWVHRSLAALEDGLPPDPERTARGLTRLLCDVLQRKAGHEAGPRSDTVLGP
jgi:hypothetical protein